MDHVFLVPGFFGFSSFGRLKYFNGVGELVYDELSRAGMHAKVVEIDTLPTASIRTRAARLLELVGSHAGDSGAIHLVGHSTGGLDARLVICPNADLRSDIKRSVVERVKTLVTVATPHFGTPLANALGGAMGRPTLKLGALLIFYLLQHGRLPVRVGLRMGRWVTRLDDFIGLKHTVADEVFDQLLAELGTEEREQLLDFLRGVSQDQALLFQLTEAGCDLLNATTGRPEQVRFGSVATCARRASLETAWRNSFDVYAQTLHSLYGVLHLLTRRTKAEWLPQLQPEQKQQMIAELGRVPDPQDNDGIVPTLAQVWGEHIGAVQADHLDVIGHFGMQADAAGSDWFPSGSGFNSEDFDSIWRRVARFIAAGEATRPS